MTGNKADSGTPRAWFTPLATAALILFVLTASIAVPLVCRPFYYAHIRALNMEETTPWTEAEIREAYDEMMDYCMKGKPFGTGVLAWSESGKDHFTDCAGLFRLNMSLLYLSGAVLLLLYGCYRIGHRPQMILGRGPLFWGGSLLMTLFVLVAGYAALDFGRFFVVFHHVFFPGKDNWIFYYDVDQIINVLPEVFFRNCGILIVSVMFLLCIGEMAADRILRKRTGRWRRTGS